MLMLSLSVSAVTISGRFVDGETNQPIAGIGLATSPISIDYSKLPRDSEGKLLAPAPANDAVLLATSDSNGRFEFEVQPFPSDSLVIEAVNPSTAHKADYGMYVGTLFYDGLSNYASYSIEVQPGEKSARKELGNIILQSLEEEKHCMATIQKPNGELLLDKENLTLDEYDAINKGIYDGTLFPGVSPDDIHNLGTQDHVKLYKNLKYDIEDAGNCFLAVSPQEGPAETLIELVGLDYRPNNKYILSPIGREVTSDSTGRIDAKFKLIDTFPDQAVNCPASQGGFATDGCQILIGINNKHGDLLRSVSFRVTGEKSRFGAWLYKNEKKTISDTYKAGVPNGTFVKTIELTETDTNSCTFLLDSKDKVTVKVGDSYTTDFQGFTAFALSVYDVRTITEDNVQKELCKMGARNIPQNVVELIINWFKLKIF